MNNRPASNATKSGARGVWLLSTVLLLWAVALPGQLGAQSTNGTAESVPPAEVARRGTMVGLGLGTGSEDMAGLITLSFPVASGEVVTRVATVSEFQVLGPPSRSSTDAAVMYGFRPAEGSRGWLRFAGGLGWVETETAGAAQGCFLFFCSYERIRSQTLGLALQADAVWAAFSSLGLGFTAFSNLNGDNSMVGFGVHLLVGRVR